MTVESVRASESVTQLEELIRYEISIKGSIPFVRFMELALYHPTLGYYRRGNDPFGVHGDFYTAEQLPVFGQMLAIYIKQFKSAFPASERFEILELGAGQRALGQVLHPWNYRAFEWGSAPLPDVISGLVIANEFFDALPVHLLRRTRIGWRELSVIWKQERFAFAEGPEEPSLEVSSYAERHGAMVPIDGLLELNLGMRNWIERIGKLLSRGRVLVIDYGYSTSELVRFSMGTVLAYRRHTTHSDVLKSPGTQDITAHVNFSQFREHAVKNGFEVLGENSLRSWALSICETGDWTDLWEAADTRWKLQWKQLAFGMGETFRVLELEKRVTK